jgi:hypothetical protein
MDIWRIVMLIFFGVVLWRIALHPTMFTKAYGRHHRIAGGILLLWLMLGYLQLGFSKELIEPLIYDLALGFIATAATLTAAFDFQKAHSHVKNIASGTLEKEATVTFSEMIEHSFYQLLNLLQIAFVHSLILIADYSLPSRLLIAFAASSLWFFRSLFPVNKFSDNYTKGQDAFSVVSILYRTKKYQYIFYKHFLLHGLTISLAATAPSSSQSIHYAVSSREIFRLYWLSLNTSYVMEFFLQTLVKKGYMAQSTLLFLQLLLMSVSSIAAVNVLWRYCDVRLGLLSLALNFLNRNREMMNVSVVAVAAYLLYRE